MPRQTMLDGLRLTDIINKNSMLSSCVDAPKHYKEAAMPEDRVFRLRVEQTLQP